MKVTYNNKKSDIHFIFFYGIGDNRKNAQKCARNLCANLQYSTLNRPRITGHTHEYPTVFQYYIAYSVVSFLFLGASIWAPVVTLLSNPVTIGTIGLASLAALICVFLSILLIIVPFVYKDQNLYNSVLLGGRLIRN
ncbi:MAG: hypothetical protein PV340_02595 [Wolbachia sp.]|nr:hypothetical protein [Wolbachia sp.]MDD9335964.1 hypothetical protein [Wolbachia sp.]